MISAFRSSCLALAAFASLAAAVAARAAPVAAEHLTIELVSATRTFAPGVPVRLGLRIVHEPEWHTYWINPGDSGLAPQVKWLEPAGARVSAFAWPVPSRLPLGPLVNFGYDGEHLLPFTLELPADAASGGSAKLRAHASWLVCKVDCIPGETDLELELPLGDGLQPDARTAGWFAAAEASTPRRVDPDASIVDRGESVDVVVRALPADVPRTGIELFPVPQQVLSAQRGEVRREGDAVVFSAAKSDYFVSMPATVDVVLAWDSEQGRRGLALTAKVAASETAATGQPLSNPPLPSEGEGVGLWTALLFALLGGVLLNLMPCVFPVLALKALSFADAARDARGARRDALAYFAGVLSTFALLGIVLLAIRAGGTSLGWGFQLQSPVFVAVLAYLMLAVGLALSTGYAFGARWAGVGQRATERSGAAGAFFTGVLACVVASPCTAPFMGPALGYALTQPPATSLAVLLALGTGLALPLTLLGFVPAAARLLPRPGAWMETFRQFMAFPMYLAAVWLVWVLGRQSGVDALALVLAGMVAFAAALWLARAPRTPLRIAFALATAALAAWPLLKIDDFAQRPATAHAQGAEPYTPARLAQLRGEGRPVFVNMTAAWCITCLANERTALATDEVESALKQHDVASLEGDWTNQDADITRYLAQFGRSGVPLYVLYPRGGGEPEVLPQLLTPGIVRSAIERAASNTTIAQEGDSR